MSADHWDRPEQLDALAAAPGNHQLLLENDRVRVLLTTIAIGATTPVHTHRWPSVEYLITAADFVRRDRNSRRSSTPTGGRRRLICLAHPCRHKRAR